MEVAQEIIHKSKSYYISDDKNFIIGSLVIDKKYYAPGEVLRVSGDTMQVKFMRETKEVDKSDYFRLVRKSFA